MFISGQTRYDIWLWFCCCCCCVAHSARQVLERQTLTCKKASLIIALQKLYLENCVARHTKMTMSHQQKKQRPREPCSHRDAEAGETRKVKFEINDRQKENA